jgi:4-alpha-glucanotransferase
MSTVGTTMRSTIYHALGLHMHQPPGNLRSLIDANPWEAEQIILCYERPLRYAAQYRDVARLHVGFSGVLLEQLMDPGVVDRYRHILDIPEMLDRYARADNIELIGMGYYHPIFPIVPRSDWPEQLGRGRAVLERAFGRGPHGFWPSEMAFAMEMIPALVQAGYDYVVVDGVHVRPCDGIPDVFRPYLACHDGVCIAVVPRDRDVSCAQQGGLDATWFQNEVCWRVGGSARPQEPRLVTTWSDGENGGWFRQTDEGAGYFGHFFAPFMERVRGGGCPIAPIAIGDYLRDHPPVAQAQVQLGAWHVGPASGLDRSEWAGSVAQRAAVEEVHRLSQRYWDLHGRAAAGAASGHLERARRLILESQTSCFLSWGDAWLPHLYERTHAASRELAAAESALAAAAPASPAPVAASASEPDGSRPGPGRGTAH